MTERSPALLLPWWRDPRALMRMATTYAIAALAGLGAGAVGVPLPFLLGPFFVIGALSALGARFQQLPMDREAAQLTVGLAVGLRFTAATLSATLALLPAMAAATLYVIAYTLVAAFIMRPLAGVDRNTAFFATAAGGVADMAIVAREHGGDAAPVAIVHALRVSVTVALVPVIVFAFGTPGAARPVAAESASTLAWLVAAFVAAFALAQVVKRTALPNPWLMSALAVGVAIGATGALSLTVPWVMVNIAQLALGAWLGSRFRREILTTLPRVAASGVVVTVFMIACAAVGAVVMAEVTTLSLTTSFLALAPAAVTEMVITAKLMNLDAEIVAAFHVMRIAVVCSTVLGVYALYLRLQPRPACQPPGEDS